MHIKMIYRLCFLWWAIFFVSCEKVISVKVENAPLQYVVEGVVSDGNDSSYVVVSKSTNVFDPNIFTGLNDAVVTVTKDNEAPVRFLYRSDGKYKGKIATTSGSKYKLEVKVDNKIFTAVSTMPQKVTMDSIYTTHRLLLNKDTYIPVVQYHDPPGLGNAYRFKVKVRGFDINTVYVYDDKLTDGRMVSQELYNFNTNDTTLQQHDWLIIEMMCIDKPIYDFWNTLNQSASGQSQTASPGNPTSNIEGGALGFFSAQTYEMKQTSAE